MEIDEAVEFVRTNRRVVLATRRRADGNPQLTPVTVGVDDAERIVISTREPAMKTANLRRDPRAAVVVMNDAFFGAYVQLEGTAEIVSLPEALTPLVEYYRSASGEHPDWAEYEKRMVEERRVLIRITVERVGPNRRG